MRHFGAFILLAVVPVLLSAPPVRPNPQIRVWPGSAAEGQGVLTEKGCLNCHSLNASGGDRAPDFAELPGRDVSPGSLAAAMWNHAPRMWEEYDANRLDIPELTPFEAADLFAYFFAILYFDPPGDGARGRSLFIEKGCASCHSELLDGRAIERSFVSTWREFREPIGWAEQMWNHANEMNAAMSNRGIRWPLLSGEDVADLAAFFASLSSPDAGPGTFSMGEPQPGRAVFENACESCHSWGPAAGGKVDLLARSTPLKLTGFVAAMWNHAPAMLARGAADSVRLRPGEMRDLAAFLFSQQYFFERGDTARGARVYEAKRCADCHGAGRVAIGAPDLFQSAELYSPIVLSSALFRHGPAMLDRMTRLGVSWPEFQGSEMADLIAYLNSRLIPRIAQ